MDDLDRKIINELQGGFPISDHPYADAAERLGINEKELLARLQHLLDDGLLTRFGPLYNAERLGGALSLCAMKIPEDQFDAVADKVNQFPQVAHNYQRDHAMNMWFVLATETTEELKATLLEIESLTGFPVFDMPKQEEFFVGLYFPV